MVVGVAKFAEELLQVVLVRVRVAVKVHGGRGSWGLERYRGTVGVFICIKEDVFAIVLVVAREC